MTGDMAVDIASMDAGEELRITLLIRLGLIQAFVTSTSILSNTRQPLLGDETFKYMSP